MDTYHEFLSSKRDFKLLSSFLTETGIMISHDCFPLNKTHAAPKFKKGAWCGETYVAFIDFAHSNPSFFYGILKIDTGIGIISKLEIESLKNNFNKEKLVGIRPFAAQSVQFAVLNIVL